ncbi:MAG: PQQ-dependent catabolism-associated beta-propeller protein [Proteobacteria bacterium]|nr:PQQ-dependent catabolism-associated beta-propeller protein [Pseudomonadota bacterium]
MRKLLPLALLALTTLPAHAQGVAWVTSEKDDAITLIDMDKLAVIGVVPTCKRPRHIAVLPGGKRLMTACGDSHQGDVIDIATRKSVARVPMGDDPEAFSLSPDGKLMYVSSEEEGELLVLEAATGKQVRAVKVGEEPEGVLAAPDGKTVWVTSEVANLVHVVDPVAGKVAKNVAVGQRPRRFALTPDGQQLWVTNELGASVTVLATKDYRTLATIPFALKGMRATDITPVGITMTRDGKTAFVALGQANHVAFVDVATRKVTQQVLVGKRAWNVHLNKGEDRLWVINGLSDDVTVVDVKAAKALKSIPVGRVPYGAVLVE